MKRYITMSALAAGLMLLGACSEDDIPSSPSYDGSSVLAAFQNYASLGNSLTAGYQSGAWGNPDHIEYSFPAQLARHLGITDFDQVSMLDTGVNSSGTGGNMVLSFDAEGSPVLSNSALNQANLLYLTGAQEGMSFAAPRNFGIPGITLQFAMGASLSAYGAGNPYANCYRTAATDTMTQFEMALASGADFMTVWLGNNDVLGFVTSGGNAEITNEGVFSALAQSMTAGLAGVEHVVVLNIPAVTAIPFVTYVTPIMRAKELAAGITEPFVYAYDDAMIPTQYSIAEGADNYILLPAQSLLSADTTGTFGLHPANPLPEYLLLDSAELAAAESAQATFNAALAAAVDDANLARVELGLAPILLADVATFFDEILTDGYTVGTHNLTTEFVTGGVFSLDGVHPTSLGYGCITAFIVEQMNEGWNLNIEPYDVNQLLGVVGGL